MKLATKTRPWLIASLCAAASVFGQNQSQSGGPSGAPICPPLKPMCQPQICVPAKCSPVLAPQQPTIAAYNAPAEIVVQADWNFFASASYLYWQPLQELSPVAFVPKDSGLHFNMDGSLVSMEFDFKPGFKVGFGMNFNNDDWDGYLEYTRAHGKHCVHAQRGESVSAQYVVLPVEMLAKILKLHLPSLNHAIRLFNNASSSFQNNLDFLDVEMGRAYYVGKYLVFRPAMGLRSAWIYQVQHTDYVADATVADAQTVFAEQGSLTVVSRSHSWGFGPRLGVRMDWNLGSGVRFFGSGYTDTLYTTYDLKGKVVATFASVSESMTTHREPDYLRTHLDLEMGLGWGTYFSNNDWHVDVTAAYGFQTFFSQSMLPVNSSGLPAESANLYVQGLTLTTRLDF